MKRPVRIIITLLMGAILATTALAQEEDLEDSSISSEQTAVAEMPSDRTDITEVIESQHDSLDIGDLEYAVPSTGADILGDMDIGANVDFESGLGRIYERGRDEVGGIFKRAIRSAVVIMIIAVMCSVCEGFFETGTFGGAPNYISLAGVLAISVVAVGDVNTFMGLGVTTLSELDSFSKALLPTLTAAAAAGGAITSATVKYAATALFMDILITLASGLLMPVIYAYIAASVAEAAIGGEGIAGATGFLKWLASTILTLLVLSFVVYISIIGIVSSTADAATVRVAKTTLSTVFPVVGSIMSDAASTVLAGASVLKNAIGVFGMLVVISVCLLPFLNLGANYILYKAVSKLSATISGSRISKLVSNIGTAFGLVMSLIGSCALMLFFSLISIIKVVTP